MNDNQEYALVSRTAIQFDPQTRFVAQVKRPACFGRKTLVQRRLAPTRSIDRVEIDEHLSVNALRRFTAWQCAESCPQAAVTINEHLKSAVKRRHVQLRLNEKWDGDLIGRRLRRELIQKPQRSLTIRERILFGDLIRRS